MKTVKENNKVVQWKGFGVSRACDNGPHALYKNACDAEPSTTLNIY